MVFFCVATVNCSKTSPKKNINIKKSTRGKIEKPSAFVFWKERKKNRLKGFIINIPQK